MFLDEDKSSDDIFLYVITGSICAVLAIIIISVSIFCVTNNKSEQDPSENAEETSYHESDNKGKDKDSHKNKGSKIKVSSYYDQLDQEEKAIYDSIKKAVYDMPNSINLPPNANMKKVGKVIDAFQNDNIVSPLLLIDKYQVSSIGTLNSVLFDYNISKAEYEAKIAQLNAKVESIAASVPKDLSDFEKELFVHDLLIKNTKYKISKKPLSNTAYGALVENETACQGYSQAMKLILDKLNIECVVVSGLAVNVSNGGPHMWNQVKIDGEWYNLDVTWDDPVSEGGEDIIAHKYFNVPDEDMSHSHIPDNQINKCTSMKHNYFNAKGMLFDSYNAKAKSKIVDALAKVGKNEAVEFRFTNEDEYAEAYKKIYSKDLYALCQKASIRSKKIINFDNTAIYNDDKFYIIELYIYS